MASGDATAALPAGLEPAQLPRDAVEVGCIIDAWGIKGWFKVRPYSASAEALFSSKRWYLLPPERGAKTFFVPALLRVREAKEHSEAVVASASEVDDRSAADALKGARIFIARSSFPSVGPDEYYWVDLMGLEVINREGVALGRVKELISTGAQTVLVIEDANAEAGKPLERMVPFVSAYVDSVDLPGKRILVDWQADY